MASSLSDNLLGGLEEEVPSIAAMGQPLIVTTERPHESTFESPRTQHTTQHNTPAAPKLSQLHGGQPSSDEIQTMMLGAMGMVTVSLTVAGGVMWGFFSFVASWSSNTVATLLTLVIAGGNSNTTVSVAS